MNKKLLLASLASLVLICGSQMANAQGQSVNTTGAAPDPSAILDVNSTTQGMLIPRMTTAQMGLISSPATGLLVYVTDVTPGFYFYTGSAWISLSTATNVTTQGNTFNGASQLVQANASGQLPAISGTNVTNLNGSAITSGIVPVNYGGTGANLSATGGAGNYLKQTTSGGAVTVGTIPYSDITGAPASLNLTGPISSTGNATSITAQTGTGTTFAMSASPALTGTPTAPTGTLGDNSTQIATDAFVLANAPSINLTGPISSVGNATSITAQTGTGTTFAMSASPALTGTPSAPTATVGTNTTQIATTAFVLANGTGFATPTGTVNISAPTAGVATTAIRSDATLQLSQTIVPTWSGLHTFTGGITSTGTTAISISGDATSTTVGVGNGAGVKSVTLGSTNATSGTTVQSGSTGVNINAGNSQPTNINTSGSTGAVAIGNNSTLSLNEAAIIDNINASTAAANATNIGTGTTTGAVKIGNATGGTFLPQFNTATATTGVLTMNNNTGQITESTAGVLIGVKVITATSTYTPDAGTNAIYVIVVGAGGGGGGGDNTYTSGGGGGAGGVCYKYITGVGALTGACTIGTGGGGGACVAGSTGGATTFVFNSVTYTANSGAGGATTNTATTTFQTTLGGIGGTASGGDINAQGASGQSGFGYSGGLTVANAMSGAGASTSWGGGGKGIAYAAGNGNAGSGFGAGGSGCIITTSCVYTGGSGSAGGIIIYEYR